MVSLLFFVGYKTHQLLVAASLVHDLIVWEIFTILLELLYILLEPNKQ
jgi:hypothetical protein